MEQSEIIWIASVAIGKGYGYETMKYSDYLYGHENMIDAVWEYVTECNEIGRAAFREKYANFKLYTI